MRISRGAYRRNFHGEQRVNLSAALRPRSDGFMLPGADLDTQTVTQLIAGALRRHYADKRSAAKELAEDANSNVRTAENWLSGRNAPHIVHLIRLAREIPQLQELLRQLLGWEANLDPAFERDLNALIGTYRRLQTLRSAPAADMARGGHAAAAPAPRGSGDGPGGNAQDEGDGVAHPAGPVEPRP